MVFDHNKSLSQSTKKPSSSHEWIRRLSRSAHGHYEASKLFRRRSRRMGVLLIILTGTLTWMTFLKHPVLNFLQPCLGLVAFILASLLTFLNLDDRASQHAAAASEYAALRRKVENVMTSSENREAIQQVLEGVLEEYRVISRHAPVVPENLWGDAQRRYPK